MSRTCTASLSFLIAACLAACSPSADPVTPVGTGGAGHPPSGSGGATSNPQGSGGMATAVTATGGSDTNGSGGTTSSGGATSNGGAAPTGGAAGGGVVGTGGAGARGGAAGQGGSAGGARATAGSTGSGGNPDPGSLPAITIHMAGDSTMADYAASTTQEGWGQEFGQFFISKVTIDNQALGGANIQSFFGSRWKTLINNIKAGDYVFVAFGINDSGTTHGPVTPQAFQVQMETMADEVAAKKATMIPTTSSPLQVWSGATINNSRLQPYCDVTKAVGMRKTLLVDDLNARGVEYYNMIGMTAANALTFNGDKAHFNKQGATEMARLASQELKRINSPLAAYLK